VKVAGLGHGGEPLEAGHGGSRTDERSGIEGFEPVSQDECGEREAIDGGVGFKAEGGGRFIGDKTGGVEAGLGRRIDSFDHRQNFGWLACDERRKGTRKANPRAIKLKDRGATEVHAHLPDVVNEAGRDQFRRRGRCRTANTSGVRRRNGTSA